MIAEYYFSKGQHATPDGLLLFHIIVIDLPCHFYRILLYTDLFISCWRFSKLPKRFEKISAFANVRPHTMKAIFLASAVLIFLSANAQNHPLVGTWEMVSIEGINADGKAFKLDTADVRETKIITSTHYMLIAMDVRGDSLVFNRSYAGEVKMDGNRYLENPLVASVQIFNNVKSDFKWKVEGDVFTQSGSFTRPDGKKIILHSLKFRRVTSATVYPANPCLGTWTKRANTSNAAGAGSSGLLLVTPSHWMEISHVNGKFEYATGGTYIQTNGKSTLHTNIGISPNGPKAQLTSWLSGNTLLIKRSSGNASDDREDVYERIR